MSVICIECEDNISRDAIDMKQCVDCHGFFCVNHIQEKENRGLLCISCELEITNSFYNRREALTHPQYYEPLI